MKIICIVKEKGIQVEMGHRGCCTLRKAEQQAGERRSGKKPQLGNNWKGAAGREGVRKVAVEELTREKRRTAERKAMGKKVVQTKSERNKAKKEAIARGDKPGERRARNLREAMERKAEKERKKMERGEGKSGISSVVVLAPPRASSTPGPRSAATAASTTAAKTAAAEKNATKWSASGYQGYPSWRRKPQSASSTASLL